MGPRLSRRHALLGSTTFLATPFLGSLMAHAQSAAIDASPLLAPWPGGHGGVPPWDKFAPAMFPPAFEAAMAELRRDVLAIRDATTAPSFATVILPMENMGATMDRVQAAWGVYVSNLASRQVQDINREWSPKLTKFYDELFLDPKLFARVKAAYDNRAAENSTPSSSACSHAPIAASCAAAPLCPMPSAPRSAGSTRRSPPRSPISAARCWPTKRPGSSSNRPISPACPTPMSPRSRPRRTSASFPANMQWSTRARRSSPS